ncbi:DUF3006 domain-containing protein [Virgibacillus sp. MSJ-26]|uniref:DUF3006 domain-containing protein n=1 Tax=Virgibacillus sp. MSJ-26 TaxID=2841522 RepID=UPI001C1114CD|nr:DUF3006 domain-containing protein [Virgibacillus sp. MSJ-26]MBU5468330.1 DUF3006 domain-containing protein [Virgibacillus sp. MSJ-26]
MKGVLDRLEENKAVILIEESKQEIVINKNQLPANSVTGTWFTIEKQEGRYHFTIDQAKTEQKKQTSSDLMAKLRTKSGGSKFKKK